MFGSLRRIASAAGNRVYDMKVDSAEKVPLNRLPLRKRLVFSVAGSWNSML
jgi:hypothetical protein